MAKSKKQSPEKRYTSQDGQAAASKFGQVIGEAFADVVYQYIRSYIAEKHPDYALLEPAAGKKQVRLKMAGGTSRQMDNVIRQINSDDPVVLFESKWLKDGRHHNDKGAWILQLREISRQYPTVRGAIANLAGYWTEGVRVMFENEGGVRMVLVATDDEVYRSLQPYVDAYVTSQNLEALPLDDIAAIRNQLPRAWDLANCLISLKQFGEMSAIAQHWLDYERAMTDDQHVVLGKHLVERAIDEVLEPLPESPQIVRFEISLEVDSGNIIYEQFSDLEEAFDFLQRYTRQPQAILKRITPRPRTDKPTEEEG